MTMRAGDMRRVSVPLKLSKKDFTRFPPVMRVEEERVEIFNGKKWVAIRESRGKSPRSSRS
jgi:hypothetical protein